MNVLVVGSGGREHALCEALARSPLLTKLWCAPGNPGTAAVATNVAIEATDSASLVGFAQANDIALVVPGPEAPLVAGLTDALIEAGIPCCGPSRAAARLEASKTFAKEICDALGIPTARWERFEDVGAARDFVGRRGAPIVVKADGLAAGKGVVVAATVDEAIRAVDTLGRQGPLVIEECLAGQEASFFALCDGRHAIPLGAAQDHKRLRDGDAGPNTGGMGAVTPTTALPAAATDAIMDAIVRPVLREMERIGAPFRGILFVGLMLTDAGPHVIEFNVRFGDPECQALLSRLRSDLLPALLAAHDGVLDTVSLRWSEESAVAVVLAARGYPEAPAAGGELRGIDRAAALPGVRVFHSGTTATADGRIVAAGGRVLTVCGTGRDVDQARSRAYAAVRAIDYADGVHRNDIGWRAITR